MKRFAALPNSLLHRTQMCSALRGSVTSWSSRAWLLEHKSADESREAGERDANTALKLLHDIYKYGFCRA
jgi:hypothetical protein